MSLRRDLQSSLEVVNTIGQLIKAHVGPFKSTKCIQGEDGCRYVRNVAMLLDSLDIEHPVGQYIVGVCRAFLLQYHTGEDTLLYFIYSWTRAATLLCQMGIPALTVIGLLKAAVGECIDHVNTLKVNVGNVVDGSKGENKLTPDKWQVSINSCDSSSLEFEPPNQSMKDNMSVCSNLDSMAKHSNISKLKTDSIGVTELQVDVSDDGECDFKMIELKSLCEQTVENGGNIQDFMSKDRRKGNEQRLIHTSDNKNEPGIPLIKNIVIDNNNDTRCFLIEKFERIEDEFVFTPKDIEDSHIIELEMKTELDNDEDISWFFKKEEIAAVVDQTNSEKEISSEDSCKDIVMVTLPYKELESNASVTKVEQQQDNSLTSQEASNDVNMDAKHCEKTEIESINLVHHNGVEENKDFRRENISECEDDLVQDIKLLKAAIEENIDTLKQNRLRKMKESNRKQETVVNRLADTIDSEFDTCFEMSQTGGKDREHNGEDLCRLNTKNETEASENEFKSIELSFEAECKSTVKNHAVKPGKHNTDTAGKDNDNSGNQLNVLCSLQQNIMHLNHLTTNGDDEDEFKDGFNESNVKVPKDGVLFCEHGSIKGSLAKRTSTAVCKAKEHKNSSTVAIKHDTYFEETKLSLPAADISENCSDEFEKCFIESSESKLQRETNMKAKNKETKERTNELDITLNDEAKSDKSISDLNGKCLNDKIDIKGIDLLLKQFGKTSNSSERFSSKVVNNSRHFKTFQTTNAGVNKLNTKFTACASGFVQPNTELKKKPDMSLSDNFKHTTKEVTDFSKQFQNSCSNDKVELKGGNCSPSSPEILKTDVSDSTKLHFTETDSESKIDENRTSHTCIYNTKDSNNVNAVEKLTTKVQEQGIDKFIKSLKLTEKINSSQGVSTIGMKRSNITLRSRHLNNDIDEDFDYTSSVREVTIDGETSDTCKASVHRKVEITKERIETDEMVETRIDYKSVVDSGRGTKEENDKSCPTDLNLSDLHGSVFNENVIKVERGNEIDGQTNYFKKTLSSGLGVDEKQYEKKTVCQNSTEGFEESYHKSMRKIVAGLNPGVTDDVVDVVGDLVLKHSSHHNVRLDESRLQCHNVEGIHRAPLIIDGVIVMASSDNVTAVHNLRGKTCRVLLVNADIVPSYRHKGYKAKKSTTILTGNTFESHMTKSDHWLREVQMTLSMLAVDVVLARGLISEEMFNLCASLNVVAIETVAYQQLVLLSEATCVDMATYITLATQDNICSDIFLSELDTSWYDTINASIKAKHEIVVTMAMNNTQTVVVSEMTSILVDLKTQEFWDSVHRVASALNTGSLLPGYGATEMSCVQFCRERSEHLKKRSHAAIQVEQQYLPMVLDILESTFQEYVDTVQKCGNFTSYLENKKFDCIYDDNISKIEAWRMALDTVCTLMNTDSYIITGLQEDHSEYRKVVTL